LRRTQAAVQADWLHDGEPPRILLCGGADEWQATQSTIRSELGQEVDVVDPFAVAGVEPRTDLSQRGGFASLLGAQLDAIEGIESSVDFLHPKRPAPPASKRRPAMIAAASAGLLLLGGVYSVYAEFADIDEKNAQLAEEIKDLDATSRKGERRQAIASAVSAWHQGGVNWLETLQGFSEKFPASGNIVLTRMAMGPSRDGGGSITFQGMARDPSVLQAMEQAVRDAGHEVETPKVQERLQDRAYPWQFEATVTIAGKQPPAPEPKAGRR
jgi:Tfp pilus assembly protein PilN